MTEVLDTRKTLDTSVNNIRAQGLSFNKDGFDFTLSVPDTQDVKNVFGTMTSTIVSQEEHIEEMNNTMVAMEAEFKRDQERIMQWAHESIETLNSKNDILANMLNQTRQQLRAMTYNMKGIDDGAKDDDLIDAMKQAEVVKTGKPAPKVISGESLFATEEGGTLSPSKLSRPPSSPNLVPVSAAAVQEESINPDSTPSPEPEKIEEKIEDVKDEQEEENISPENSQEVTSLLSAVLEKPNDQLGSPPKPPVILSEDRSPRALWKWAYRKVVAKNMIVRIGMSFMNTLVKEEDTVMSRLEKIEKSLFFLPGELRGYTDVKTTALDEKITSEVGRLDAALVAFDKQVCDNFNVMGEKISAVATDLSGVSADLEALKVKVEDLLSNSFEKLQGEVDELARWRAECHQQKLKALMEQFEEFSEMFADLTEKAEEVTGTLGTTIKNNQRIYDADPSDSLATLLTIDTNMRSSRESLVRLETGVKAAVPVLTSLKQDMQSVLGEEEAGLQLERIENMLSMDLDKVLSSTRQAGVSLKQHDAIVAERWRALSEMLKSVKEVGNITSKIEVMEGNISCKASPEDVEEIVKPQIDAAIGAAVEPLEARHSQATEQTIILSERMTKVEESMEDAAMEGKPVGGMSGGIGDSPQMAALSGLLHGEGGDVESALGPLIKGLVEMYCQDWEHGGSHDADEYDDYESGDYDDHEEGDVEGGGMLERDSRVVSEDQDQEERLPSQGGSRPAPHAYSYEEDQSQAQAQGQAQHGQAQGQTQSSKDIPENISVTDSVPNSVPASITPSPRPTTEGTVSISGEGVGANESANISAPSDTPSVHPQQDQPQPQPQPSRINTASSSNPNVGKPPSSEQQQQQQQSKDKPRRSSRVDKDRSRGRDREKLSSRSKTSNAIMPDGSQASPTLSHSSATAAGGGPRSRGRARGGVDPAELQGLRQEVSRLNEKLADISARKIDTEAVKVLMNQKADSKLLAKKVDANVVTTIEDEVQSCLRNIGDLRALQGEEMDTLKADLGRKIKASLKAMFRAKEDEGKGTSASTKAICLSCGQDSPMQVHPSKHPHPSFLPSLNSHSTVGPDVHRGGFKLPVHIPTKVSKYADFLDPDLARELSQDMSVKAMGGVTGDRQSPEGNIGESGFESLGGGSVLSSHGRKTPLVRPSASSTSSYVEDQNSIRPLFRKGFPAKRSNRPSAYAPELYEVDPSIQVLSRSAKM